MKAIILLAGASRRLLPLTEKTPKCLLPVGERTILQHQLSALESVGVRDVIMVVGYRQDQIVEAVRGNHPGLQPTFITNHEYADTGTAYSLWLAGDQFMDQEFLYLNGDVLFPPILLKRLLDDPGTNALAVELKACNEEEVKVLANDQGRIMDLSKQIEIGASLGEFIGVARFSAGISRPFHQALGEIITAGQRKAYFEDALRTLVTEHDLHLVDITDLPCVEIDFVEDLQRAREIVAADIYRNL